MKYTVTGGAGFIGSSLVDELIERGHEVIVIDNLVSGKEENINPKAKFILADINGCRFGSQLSSCTDKVIEAVKGSDSIFHLAALARVQPSIDNPVRFHDANVNGTLNILMLARELGIRRVIYSASSSAYGNATIFPTPETHPTDPMSPYGLQKLIGEQYCKIFSRCYDLETVALDILMSLGGDKVYLGLIV